MQLRRAKGWRMPANTVKVDRTTLFGNPFSVKKEYGHEHAVALVEPPHVHLAAAGTVAERDLTVAQAILLRARHEPVVHRRGERARRRY